MLKEAFFLGLVVGALLATLAAAVYITNRYENNQPHIPMELEP